MKNVIRSALVLTVAVAEVLLEGGSYAEAFRRHYRARPGRGYGASKRELRPVEIESAATRGAPKLLARPAWRKPRNAARMRGRK